MHLLSAARLFSVVVCPPGGMTVRPQAVLWDALLQPHPPCAVPCLQVDARQTLKHPPLPLATLSLQKEAITHLRMPGDLALTWTQDLRHSLLGTWLDHI